MSLPVEITDLSDFDSWSGKQPGCAVALGTFDGVHCGHAAILNRAAACARRRALVSIALTFDRLPLELLKPEAAPRLLTPLDVRVRLLKRYVDRVVVARFSPELAQLGPAEFVERVLVRGLNCRAVCAGFNYTFGHKATGRADTLVSLGGSYGIDVEIVPPVIIDNHQVSSTFIRQLVQSGNVETAQQMLGRPFTLSGPVVTGQARGRQLGYPTANVQPDPRCIIPAEGVYITHIRLGAPETGGQELGVAVTAVSSRPTFNGGTVSIESHILNYSGELYDSVVSLYFHRRLRDIRKFADMSALRAQIALDVAQAREYAECAIPRLQV